jgi:hypothetical protein
MALVFLIILYTPSGLTLSSQAVHSWGLKSKKGKIALNREPEKHLNISPLPLKKKTIAVNKK